MLLRPGSQLTISRFPSSGRREHRPSIARRAIPVPRQVRSLSSETNLSPWPALRLTGPASKPVPRPLGHGDLLSFFCLECKNLTRQYAYGKRRGSSFWGWGAAPRWLHSMMLGEARLGREPIGSSPGGAYSHRHSAHPRGEGLVLTTWSGSDGGSGENASANTLQTNVDLETCSRIKRLAKLRCGEKTVLQYQGCAMHSSCSTKQTRRCGY